MSEKFVALQVSREFKSFSLESNYEFFDRYIDVKFCFNEKIKTNCTMFITPTLNYKKMKKEIGKKIKQLTITDEHKKILKKEIDSITEVSISCFSHFLIRRIIGE